MPSSLRRGATRDLTRLGLVLSHGRGPGRWIARAALVLIGVLIGVAGSQWVTRQGLGELVPAPSALQATQQLQAQQQRDQLQREQLQRFEQSELNLHLAESRGHELERQLAGLIQQLRECNEELSFFRKNRDTKH